MRGRNECGFLAPLQDDGLVEAFRQVLALRLEDVGQRLPQRLGRLPDHRRALRRPRAARTPNRRRAAGLAISTCCCWSTTSTGSGKESIVAWLVCCARINWALCDWRKSRSCRAMVLKAPASCPSSSSEVMGTSWSRLPAPMAMADSVTARIGIEDRANRAGDQEHGQRDAEGQAAAVPEQRGAGQAERVLVGLLHVLLVDAEDLAGDGLDFAEGLVEARLALLPKYRRSRCCRGVGEELVSLLAIMLCSAPSACRPVPSRPEA